MVLATSAGRAVGALSAGFHAARRNFSTANSASATKPLKRILLTGASGQIGQELVPYLAQLLGAENIIASDIKPVDCGVEFKYLDVTNADALAKIAVEGRVDAVVHLASLLSAVGEQNPQLALQINTRGTEHVLELARAHGLRVFIPSTIGAFGPSTPRHQTPDVTIQRPTTVYGISKVYTELLGEYYHRRYGVDFRCVRYPGIISSEALPGGGTTDYAVDIYYSALLQNSYTCFLKDDTELPMMYMPDAVRGTAELLMAPREKLTACCYNMAAMSYTPAQAAESVKKFKDGFKIDYDPDFRQAIADSWPASLDDSQARADWGWAPEWDLDSMSKDMLVKLEGKLSHRE